MKELKIKNRLHVGFEETLQPGKKQCKHTKINKSWGNYGHEWTYCVSCGEILEIVK